MHLVIGGRGLIGGALVEKLFHRDLAYSFTSRRKEAAYRCDLAKLDVDSLPPASFVYLVAALPRFADCEALRESWIVNVDAPIAIARHYHKGAFVVFMSSDTVEYAGSTAYGRQKAHAEAYMQSIDAAIVRPVGKVMPERAPELAGFLIDIALRRASGVHRWS